MIDILLQNRDQQKYPTGRRNAYGRSTISRHNNPNFREENFKKNIYKNGRINRDHMDVSSGKKLNPAMSNLTKHEFDAS